jgi:hypothetical protein
VTPSNRPGSRPFARVTFPGDRGYLRLSRATAAAFGDSVGLPEGRIDDLGLAVDEAVAWLLDAAEPGGWIEVTFEGDRVQLTVDGRFHGTAGALYSHDQLIRAVLQATTESFELFDDSGQRRFVLSLTGGRERRAPVSSPPEPPGDP